MSKEQTIPVVDLEDYASEDPEVRAAFVETFGAGLQKFGFVAVENHGVPEELIDRNYELFREFFALDDDIKQQYEQPESGRQRGYTPFGVEKAKDKDVPDLKEFWHVGQEIEPGSELEGRLPNNVWPEELPQLRQNNLELFRSMESSAMQMLAAISEYLTGEPATIPGKAENGNSVLRIIHYPPTEGIIEPGAMRAAEHEDINLITLLPSATSSGLEILTRDGEWLPVPALEGQMIVDTGDMMKRLTNDVMPATTHRVVNPDGSNEERYSMPFFVHPHPDASLDVLPECVEDGEEPKYEPITADEFLQERLREIGVA
jgi:isopenicillin N synthase-like dioxygenase